VTEYTITGSTLELTVEGMDKLWALRSHLSIPLHDITEVHSEPNKGVEALSGVKVAGARIPGVLQAGTFAGTDGLMFWDVHRPGHAIVISLEHEHYRALVVDVQDPDTAAAEIGQAAANSRS